MNEQVVNVKSVKINSPPVVISKKTFIKYLIVPSLISSMAFINDEKPVTLNEKMNNAIKVFIYLLLLIIFSKLFGYVLKSMVQVSLRTTLVTPLLAGGVMVLELIFIIVVDRFTNSILT